MPIGQIGVRILLLLLDFKKIRLFRVDEQISDNNYRLSLLAIIKLRIYVFHVLLLKLALKDV